MAFKCYQIHTHFNTNKDCPLGVSLSASTDPDSSPCVEYLTCSQTFWRRFLGALFANYSVMVSLDQICTLSDETEKLPDDTAQIHKPYPHYNVISPDGVTKSSCIGLYSCPTRWYLSCGGP